MGSVRFSFRAISTAQGPVLSLALWWPENAFGRTARMFRALAGTGGDRLWTENVSRETRRSLLERPQFAERKSLLFMGDGFYSRLLH